MRAVTILVLALAGMAAPVRARAQDDAGPKSCAACDVAQTDLFDLWNRLRHKPPSDPAEKNNTTLAVTPIVGSNPTAGTTFGAAGQLTFVRGDPATTRLSSGIGSVTYSTKRQLLVSARYSVFTTDNRWFIEGDNRFQLAGQDVYGLGTETPSGAAFTTDYDFVRVHETLYRRIANGVYVGAGLLVDSHANVHASDDEPADWSQSPYVTYSNARDLPIESQQSTGASVNLLVDRRDGEIDPRGGWLGAASYRTSWSGLLGGDSSWDSTHLELRTYIPVRRRSRLAAWIAGDFSRGDVPYFELPATVMDMYGRSSRGYQEGRYRGERQIYAEIEYRATLTDNGLVGAVLFANATTVTNLETNEQLFEAIAPAAGGGLRLLLSKRTRTNICIDVAWGKQGARGVYFALQDAF